MPILTASDWISSSTSSGLPALMRAGRVDMRVATDLLVSMRAHGLAASDHDIVRSFGDELPVYAADLTGIPYAGVFQHDSHLAEVVEVPFAVAARLPLLPQRADSKTAVVPVEFDPLSLHGRTEALHMVEQGLVEAARSAVVEWIASNELAVAEAPDSLHEYSRLNLAESSRQRLFDVEPSLSMQLSACMSGSVDVTSAVESVRCLPAGRAGERQRQYRETKDHPALVAMINSNVTAVQVGVAQADSFRAWSGAEWDAHASILACLESPEWNPRSARLDSEHEANAIFEHPTSWCDEFNAYYLHPRSLFLPLGPLGADLQLHAPSGAGLAHRAVLASRAASSMIPQSALTHVERAAEQVFSCIADDSLPHIEANPYRLAPLLPRATHSSVAPWSATATAGSFDPLSALNGSRQDKDMAIEDPAVAIKAKADPAEYTASLGKLRSPTPHLREGLHLAARHQAMQAGVSASDMRTALLRGAPISSYSSSRGWTAFPSIDLSIRTGRAHNRQTPLDALMAYEQTLTGGSSSAHTPSTTSTLVLADAILAPHATCASASSSSPKDPTGTTALARFELIGSSDAMAEEMLYQSSKQSSSHMSCRQRAKQPRNMKPDEQDHRVPAATSNATPAEPTKPPATKKTSSSADQAPRSSRDHSEAPSTPIRGMVAPAAASVASVQSHVSRMSSTSRRSARRITDSPLRQDMPGNGAIDSAANQAGRWLNVPHSPAPIDIASPASHHPASVAHSVSSTSSHARRVAQPAEPALAPLELPPASRLVLCNGTTADGLAGSIIGQVAGHRSQYAAASRRLDRDRRFSSLVEIDRETAVLCVHGDRFDPAQAKQHGASTLHEICATARGYPWLHVVLLLVGPHVDQLFDAFNSLYAMVSALGLESVQAEYCFSKEHVKQHVDRAVRSSIERSAAVAKSETDAELRSTLLDHSEWKNPKEGTWEQFLASLPGCGPTAAQEVLTGWDADGDGNLSGCILDLQQIPIETILMQASVPPSGNALFVGGIKRAISFCATKEPMELYERAVTDVLADVAQLTRQQAAGRANQAASAPHRVRRYTSSLDAPVILNADPGPSAQPRDNRSKVSHAGGERGYGTGEPHLSEPPAIATTGTQVPSGYATATHAPSQIHQGGRPAGASDRLEHLLHRPVSDLSQHPIHSITQHRSAASSSLALPQGVAHPTAPAVRSMWNQSPTGQSYYTAQRTYLQSMQSMRPGYASAVSPHSHAPSPHGNGTQATRRRLGAMLSGGAMKSLSPYASGRVPAAIGYGYPAAPQDARNDQLRSPAVSSLSRARQLALSSRPTSAVGALRPQFASGHHTLLSSVGYQGQQHQQYGYRPSVPRGRPGSRSQSMAGSSEWHMSSSPAAQQGHVHRRWPHAVAPADGGTGHRGIHSTSAGASQARGGATGTDSSSGAVAHSTEEHVHLSGVRVYSGTATPEEVMKLRSRRLGVTAGNKGGQSRLQWS